MCQESSSALLILLDVLCAMAFDITGGFCDRETDRGDVERNGFMMFYDNMVSRSQRQRSLAACRMALLSLSRTFHGRQYQL